MANYCVYKPSKGQALFAQLKKEFGYDLARTTFLQAINPQFISDYKDTLSLDAEGVPSFSSLMRNEYMKEFIGEKRMSEALTSRYHAVEDTIDNFSTQLELAYQFNSHDDNRDNYVASVEYVENGIQVVVSPRTKESMDRFHDQYSAFRLNEKLASIFSPIGITVGRLSQAEQMYGRVGVTDFNMAKDMANGFSSMIRVANNMEGANAISEEFSHLIIGALRNEPLISRSINTLQDHPAAMKALLGDDFDDVVSFYGGDMSLVAEEAAGHLLQKNLLRGVDNLPNKTLLNRMLTYIKNKFKSFRLSDVEKAIADVDSRMGMLAKNILNGTTQISREDIKNSQREAQFNALSDRISRNIEILREAAKVETKRYKITKSAKKKIAEAEVDKILSYTTEDANTVEGLLKYANTALNELMNIEAQFQSIDKMETEDKFKFLRVARSFIQSYGSFINNMNNAIIEEESEGDNMFLDNMEINGREVNMQDIIKELNGLVINLTTRYSKVAMPMFAEFLRPFLGEEIVVPFGKNAGKKITVDALLQEADSDISFMDRWLDSMANSSDTLLQLFDAAVKAANDRARLETMDKIRDIQRLMLNAEKYGITSFEWVFEKDSDGHKSGNYISNVNYAQFEKDRAEFENYLNEKYGVNPTEEEAIAKIQEKNEWYNTHALSVFGSPMPDPVLYHNKDYDKLSEHQHEILQEFLNLKNSFDSLLPQDRVSPLKAIQQRKKGTQRFIDSTKSISDLFTNIKEGIANEFLEREDDDQIFGDTKVSKGMTDFAGNEYMILPVLYTNKLKNPDELSTDIFASLMSYAYMAIQYKEMDKIIDPLEVGRTLVTENRKVNLTRGGKLIREKIGALGVDAVNKVFKSNSNSEAKLKDFFESQVYHKYLKDQGTFDLFGKQVNWNKLTNFLLSSSSLAQLGFNWLANMANITTGVGMQNIEAMSGEFFSPKELASADAIYASEIVPFMAEIGSRVKRNKLALFDELFNVRMDFGDKVKHNQKKNLFHRVFGAHIAFLGQDAGDHWLYNRSAIAMAKRQQVLLNGKRMSLWDALEVRDRFKDSDIKELNYRDIRDLDGNPFDTAAFSRLVANVNQTSFGIYNEEDSNAANRVAMGRLLQQYRKWMKVQFNRRFEGQQYNVATKRYEEGYYITIGRLINELRRGEIQLGSMWGDLTDTERANVRRGVTEILQFFAVWALANLVEWPDDKNRPWLMKLAEYAAMRATHELGGLTPSPIMLQENLKTIKTPLPITSVLQNTINLIGSAVDPRDWVDETSSGPYKGLSTLEKNLIKAPLPGVAQYRQIDKFVGDLDTSIQYYMRPTN